MVILREICMEIVWWLVIHAVNWIVWFSGMVIWDAAVKFAKQTATAARVLVVRQPWAAVSCQSLTGAAGADEYTTQSIYHVTVFSGANDSWLDPCNSVIYSQSVQSQGWGMEAVWGFRFFPFCHMNLAQAMRFLCPWLSGAPTDHS